MRRTWVIPVLGVIAAGCVSQSGSVRVVHSADAVKACTHVATVTARSIWGGATGRESNKASMRSEADSRGGDTLLIVSETGLFIPHSVGEVYRCVPVK
jgi:hypothetical protein